MPADLQPDDVHQILRRAADLQARTQGTSGLTGLTPADLETLGQEIGIDPRYVAEALRQRARDADAAVAPSGGLFGGPAHAVSERTLPAALTDDLWAQIAAEGGRLARTPGRTGTDGSGRTWTGTRTRVTATPARDGTRVRIERRTADTGALMIALPMTVVFLFAMLAAMGYALAGLGAGALALVVTFLAARFAYGRHVRRTWSASEQALDRLELDALREPDARAATAAGTGTAAGTATGTASGARLSLPSDPAPETSANAPDRLRTGA